MKAYRRPIQRVLIVGCIGFVILLCVALSLQSYFMYSSWFYQVYSDELTHVITAVEGTIDVDDLRMCIETNTESPKFDALQRLVNTYVDDFELSYLYVSIPREDGTMVSVCSSTSAEEFAAGDEDWPINYLITEEYDEESIKPYLRAWESSETSFFESDSGWGKCFTVCRPLFSSDGKKVALLCADAYTADMHREINAYVLRSIVLIVAIGFGFCAILIVWLRRNVTEPVEALERSARSFAEKSHERKDPDLLLFDAPEIHTGNELESLSDAITKMSKDMRDYVKDIITAEQRAESAEAEIEGMSRIAYEDPLTHVKSKAAYELRRALLEQEIEEGTAEFALVMMDLNNLKYVNDTYGHERGNDYIRGACRVACHAFSGSEVYRIGGDEFVIVVQGEDYHRRTELLMMLENHFRLLAADESREPWRRYSAAVGMAEWCEDDEGFEHVFGRADKDMYRNKIQMKGRRPR